MQLEDTVLKLLEENGLTVKRAKVFGVDYFHVEGEQFGDLYVTYFGVRVLRYLLPGAWNDSDYYQEHPELRTVLEGSSHPMKVTTKPFDKKTLDMVVKWCRIGRDVFVQKGDDVDFVSDEELDKARWNGPFEEFGLLMDLRDTSRSSPTPIRTQRPLAIYSPPERAEPWQMGRHDWIIDGQNLKLKEHQEVYDGEPIVLDIRRSYAMLYEWVQGESARDAFLQLCLGDEYQRAFTKRMYEDLLFRGFKVLDTKPEHAIVRTVNGKLLRDHRGNVPYALVDFELLERTKAGQKKHKQMRRARYWFHMAHRNEIIGGMPSMFSHEKVFEVDYVLGKTTTGGRLFVVGKNPELFEFFDPLKWRKTRRIKCSENTFRTRTLDDIELIYKKSSVGEIPTLPYQAEIEDSLSLSSLAAPGVQHPFTALVERIKAFGINSPFEEVAIAQELRALGMSVIYPRAIYQTGHESLPDEFLDDHQRFLSHSNLYSFRGEKILQEEHDYYVLWGCWRGMDPHEGYKEKGHWGLTGLEQAHDNMVITDAEYHHLVELVKPQLEKLGFSERIDLNRIILTFKDGELQRDENGECAVTICFDAYRAKVKREKEKKEREKREKEKHEGNIPGEEILDAYLPLLSRMRNMLLQHGYEPIALSGKSILLSSDLHGNLRRTEDGELAATLCNFELIRAPWMIY